MNKMYIAACDFMDKICDQKIENGVFIAYDTKITVVKGNTPYNCRLFVDPKLKVSDLYLENFDDMERKLYTFMSLIIDGKAKLEAEQPSDVNELTTDEVVLAYNAIRDEHKKQSDTLARMASLILERDGQIDYLTRVTKEQAYRIDILQKAANEIPLNDLPDGVFEQVNLKIPQQETPENKETETTFDNATDPELLQLDLEIPQQEIPQQETPENKE